MKKNCIWEFINKNIDYIYLSIVIFLAFLIRLFLLKNISGDYVNFLRPWFNELQGLGGLSGLSKSIGNYTPPYMTILALLTYLPVNSLFSIKMVSIIFDFIGAFAIRKIVLELLKEKPYKQKVSLLFFAIYLFLPTVVLNSAYWAQCDQIYTAFILISILFLLKNNFKKGIIFWSVAFAFKFQAIFIFPLFILMYISNRKIKLRYFLFIPLILFILGLPKIYFSHDILAPFKAYFEQANTYTSYITLNLSNFYSIFFKGPSSGNPNLIQTSFDTMGIVAVIFTLMIFVTIAYFTYIKKIKFDQKAIIEFSLFSVLIATFFLPYMHDRYLFMGDVLALLYLILNKKKFYIPLAIELISLNGYIHYLFNSNTGYFSKFGYLFLIVLIIYTRDMIKNYFSLEKK